MKEEKNYRLSPLGIQLFEDKVSFESLFRRQMLRYFSLVSEKNDTRILFPYRACLKILLEVKSINFIEFVFALYSLVDSSPKAITEAVKNIEYLRTTFPKLEILSEANKPKILKELNAVFGTNFSATDIWEKKTTIINQYIYFRDHLSLFNEFIKIDNKKGTITLVTGADKDLKSFLSTDSSLEREKNSSVLKKTYIQKLILFLLFTL
jgi:hypothetical protein